jgi:L-rhamnonate dehydratase
MKITEIRTRVLRWRGNTVSLPPHFCTNPMDVMELPEASMRTFAFHGWLVAEVFTDDGLVGLGNAALAPQATKQVIDLYLKPLLIGQDPWDIERLWQHMYRRTMAFGRKGIGMVAISALDIDIALWMCWENRPSSRFFGYWEAEQKRAFPFTPRACTPRNWANWRRKPSATRTKATGL